MTAEVIQLSHRLTEAQFKAECAKLDALYGDSSRAAAAHRDQALAELFLRSGWTQEELAKERGMSQQNVARRLRFGRFLSFTPNGVNPAGALTEGVFRKLWEQTDKNDAEHDRFQVVLKLMEQDAMAPKTPRKKPISSEILKQFGNGKWHKLEDIAGSVAVEPDQVETTLRSIQYNAIYGNKCSIERKKVGKGIQYRIYKKDKTVSLQELIEKLSPLVKDLMAEGKKNMTTACPPNVLYLADAIQKLLDQWAE